MRIDIHTHPIFQFDGNTYTTEYRFLKEMDLSKMDKAVLLPIDTIPEQLDIALRDAKYYAKFYRAFQQGQDYEPDQTYSEFKRDTQKFLGMGATNEVVHDLCTRHPDRFIGFGSINPARPEKEIKESIDRFVEWGFKGIKLMPTLMFFNPEEDRMNVIYETSQDHGLVLLVHTGLDPGAWDYPPISEDANPKYLAKPAREYPDLKIIAAHMGSYSGITPGIWWEEMMQVMEKHPNIYTDIAALWKSTLFGKAQLLPKTIERVGSDRILFGSDYPMVYMYPTHTGATTIDKSNIKGKKMIMGENARILLNL